MDDAHGEGCPVGEVASFWRRLVAFAIDAILLGLAGLILGMLFFDTLARMGIYARLLGFAIALAYFGIFNSRIGGGQTPGKHLLSVRVVDAHNQLLALPRSLLRYAVLGIPFFANGLPIKPQLMISTPLGYLLALVVFGGAFAIVYLYIFNRRTRQSLHDLAVGSYVVRLDPAAHAMPFLPMWRGHLVVVALFAIVALSAPAVASRFTQSKAFAGMLPLQQMLSNQPHVMTAQVVRGWSSMNGHTTHSLQSLLQLNVPMTEDGAMAKRIAQQMTKADPNIADEDGVVVVLVYGYDLGIASGWRKHWYSFKPGELP